MSISPRPDAALVSVIAATVTGHAVLYLGACDEVIIRAALEGCDITTPVLALTTEAQHCERLRDAVPDDLRLSIHHQDAVSFLADVERHRFGFMIIDGSAARQLPLALTLLAPAGVAVGLGTLALPPPSGERIVCPVTMPGIAWIVSRRARAAPRRRGGRRVRHSL
ncbi:MAG: hypothetical protein GKR94_14325 [Gammaproteobacteria bacterium]|nr:hypothetical protein [Gammaproteobacteria bacterium]